MNTETIATKEIEVYQGQFGEFTITESDRLGVVIYRLGLLLAGLSFSLGSGLVLLGGTNPSVMPWITPLFAIFATGLAISLVTIHIYLLPLHRLLQIFWTIGTVTAIILAINTQQPLAVFIYEHPLSLLGIGFIFAALTGIYFKEAFCFNRLETKILTPVVPLLLLGHLTQILSVGVEKVLLASWSIFFIVFVVRKLLQPIPPDIGDKSVFAYLREQRGQNA